MDDEVIFGTPSIDYLQEPLAKFPSCLNVYHLQIFESSVQYINMTHHIFTKPPTFLGSSQIAFSKSLDSSGITKVAYEITSTKP